MATPPDVPFPRPLYPPSHEKGPVPRGLDVQGVKRAVSRAGFWPWQPFDDDYSEKFAMGGVVEFQKAKGIQPTGNYGEATHEALSETHRKDFPGEWAFDSIAIQNMEAADRLLNKKPDDLALNKARELLAFCRQFDGPYVFGGEHDGSFFDDDVHDGFDCSSSTSFALWKVGLFTEPRAQVSGWFENYGEWGRGKYITIHANFEHVWIEFSLPEGYFRFDTSPHGDGGRGPRVRTLRRFDFGFVHRHPKGY